MASLQVLVIDDEAALRQVLAEQIRELGYQVEHVGTGEAALKRLAKDSGGRFYAINDPRKLPKIFIHEAQVIRKAVIVEKKGLQPAITAVTEPILGTIDSGTPTIDGYVATTAKRMFVIFIVAHSYPFPRGGV